jgi:hypothetical protein
MGQFYEQWAWNIIDFKHFEPQLIKKHLIHLKTSNPLFPLCKWVHSYTQIYNLTPVTVFAINIHLLMVFLQERTMFHFDDVYRRVMVKISHNLPLFLRASIVKYMHFENSPKPSTKKLIKIYLVRKCKTNRLSKAKNILQITSPRSTELFQKIIFYCNHHLCTRNSRRVFKAHPCVCINNISLYINIFAATNANWLKRLRCAAARKKSVNTQRVDT